MRRRFYLKQATNRIVSALFLGGMLACIAHPNTVLASDTSEEEPIEALACGINNVRAYLPETQIWSTGIYTSDAADNAKSLHDKKVETLKAKIKGLRCPSECPAERRGSLKDNSKWTHLSEIDPYFPLGNEKYDKMFVKMCMLLLDFPDGTSDAAKRGECQKRRDKEHDHLRVGDSTVDRSQEIMCLVRNEVKIRGTVATSSSRDGQGVVHFFDLSDAARIGSIVGSSSDATAILDGAEDQMGSFKAGILVNATE